METKTYSINELNAATYNPRKLLESRSKEYENLKKSLNKFGMVVPIVVNERNNTVISGHQRLNVLKEIGAEKVEAVVVDVGEKEEKQLNIALNKIEGRWDYTKLEELLNTMTDKDLEFTGFADEELGLNSGGKNEIEKSIKKEPKDGIFEIYISASSQSKANEWLEQNGFDKRLEEYETTIIIDMEEI